MFGKYTDIIMVRENTGLDVAAYKQALLTIGWEKLETYDEVLCLNDTIMGLFTRSRRCSKPCPARMWISGASRRTRAKP